MRVQFSTVTQRRRLVADQPFEPEQQGKVAAPLERRFFVTGVDFGQGGIQRAPPGGSGQQGFRSFIIKQERFAAEHRGAFQVCC